MKIVSGYWTYSHSEFYNGKQSVDRRYKLAITDYMQLQHTQWLFQIICRLHWEGLIRISFSYIGCTIDLINYPHQDWKRAGHVTFLHVYNLRQAAK